MISELTAMLHMYQMNMQIRLINMLILIIIWMSYTKTRKLPFRSSRYFNVVLWLTSINMIFDVWSVYGVFHLNAISAETNRMIHFLFMGTLICVLASTYFYILSMEEFGNMKLKSMLTVVRILPLFVCLVGMSISEVHYYSGADGAYSYGTMTNFAYVAIMFYYIAALVCVVRNCKKWSTERLINIFAGFFIWGGCVIIQFHTKTILISGTGLMLMLLLNYLAFEDPKVYVNSENGNFNEIAYRKMLIEQFKKKRPFEVFQVTFKEFNVVHGRYGHEICQKILMDLSRIIEEQIGARIYSIEEETIAFMMEHRCMKCEDVLKEVLEKTEYDWVHNDNLIHITGVFYQISCPTDVTDMAGLEDTFSFMKKYQNQEERILRADTKLLEEKKRYATIINMLEYAIDNDGFEMVYQPIFSTKEKDFHSAEALVRLKDKETLGFVSPEEFIQIAEKENLIMQVGEAVLSKVCSFARENSLIEKGIRYIEVNLSGVQCIDQGLPKQIEGVLKKYGLPYDFINLEITETAAVESGEMLALNMDKLMKKGVAFSMDDFGTGYSNLAQMAEVNYELIKIDKSLIWYCYPQQRKILKKDEAENLVSEGVKKSKVILDQVIHLINKLDLKIVAEGVETEEMVSMLTDAGVEYLQGYYFSRPLGEVDFMNFIQQQ